MTFAVVPAAGRSTRMGRAKLDLPFGDSTVLERVVSTLRAGRVGNILVVVGPHTRELVPLAESAGATTILLPDHTSDMRETVQVGLRWLEERYRPRSQDLWFLAPGDCPNFAATTVRHLLEASAKSSSSSPFIPTANGRRGHPTLFTWKHATEILQIPPGSGIDSYVRTQAVREVPVDDPGVLCDVDTPADYERLRHSHKK